MKFADWAKVTAIVCSGLIFTLGLIYDAGYDIQSNTEDVERLEKEDADHEVRLGTLETRANEIDNQLIKLNTNQQAIIKTVDRIEIKLDKALNQ
jgi:hypothetical protein